MEIFLAPACGLLLDKLYYKSKEEIIFDLTGIKFEFDKKTTEEMEKYKREVIYKFIVDIIKRDNPFEKWLE